MELHFMQCKVVLVLIEQWTFSGLNNYN